jgi:hypothetical protein
VEVSKAGDIIRDNPNKNIYTKKTATFYFLLRIPYIHNRNKSGVWKDYVAFSEKPGENSFCQRTCDENRSMEMSKEPQFSRVVTP